MLKFKLGSDNINIDICEEFIMIEYNNYLIRIYLKDFDKTPLFIDLDKYILEVNNIYNGSINIKEKKTNLLLLNIIGLKTKKEE